MPDVAGLAWLVVAIGFLAAAMALVYGIARTRKGPRRPPDFKAEEEKARRLIGQE